MLNNIKLLEKAFNRIYEIENKVNYEFEPIYSRPNKDWKRSLYYNELKLDFFKDVSELGFCPYLPKTCSEQQNNKNISKLAKFDIYSKIDYIKSLYKNPDKNEINKKKSSSIFFNLNSKKIQKYILTSNRMRKNKSNVGMEFKKINKKLIMKNINNFKPVECKKNMIVLNNTKNTNKQKNINKINFFLKKNKTINKSENVFAEAESFNYEPENQFFTYNINYSRENDKYDEETDISKNYIIFNNTTNQETVKNLKTSTKNIIFRHPFYFFKKLKGSFSDRNINNNNISEKVLIKKKKYKYNILNKDKDLERYLKMPKINKIKKDVKEFRLLSYSRKLKYG